jgi:hypothetical protein
MLLLDSETCTEGGGVFIYARVLSLYDAIHGWMTRQMDEWMESFTKNNYNVL